jgi:cephalosporin hydroxylase
MRQIEEEIVRRTSVDAFEGTDFYDLNDLLTDEHRMIRDAVREFVKSHPEFRIDGSFDNKLLISVAPEGFLSRIS